jgi:hypothetical protein
MSKKNLLQELADQMVPPRSQPRITPPIPTVTPLPDVLPHGFEVTEDVIVAVALMGAAQSPTDPKVLVSRAFELADLWRKRKAVK